MCRTLHKAFLTILALAQFAQVHAQESGADSLQISVEVDQERMTVGDPLAYRVTVVSPANAAVEWPGRQRTLGPFDVVSFEHDGPYSFGSGMFSDTLRYVLTSYSVGAYSIPPFKLTYTSPGASSRIGVADSLEIVVVSVIDDEAEDIRDLKAPADFEDPLPWYMWAVVAAMIVILIVGGIVYYRYRGRPEKMPQAPVAAPARPPHDIAIEELEQLASQNWLENGQISRHYTDLSEILRRYISGRFGILALEITTTELLEHMEGMEIRPDDLKLVAELLHECDLAKFARYIPERESQSGSVQRGKEIVAATKIVLVSEELTDVKAEITASDTV